MSSQVSIYKLIDPRDGQIKYIGKTSNRLNDRRCSHLWEARKSGRKNKRLAWLKSLLNENLKPIIELVENCVSNEEANIREIFYIKKFKEEGCDLKNTQDGGEGQPPGYKFVKRFVGKKGVTPPQLIPFLSAQKGVKRTDEQRRKLSIALSGRQILKMRKAVLVIDLIDNSVSEIDSVTNTAKKLNIALTKISEACISRRSPIFNSRFVVAFKKDEFPLEIIRYRCNVTRFNELESNEYSTKLEASRESGISRREIDRLIKNNKKDKDGFNWK